MIFLERILFIVAVIVLTIVFLKSKMFDRFSKWLAGENLPKSNEIKNDVEEARRNKAAAAKAAVLKQAQAAKEAEALNKIDI